MKKTIYLIVAVIILIVAGALLFRNYSSNTNEHKVAATIFPVYDITKKIAGDEVEVILILPAGASPHTFDLTPKKARELSGSQVVFSIGYGLDNWTSNLVASGDIQKAVIVDKYIDLHEFSEEEHSHEEEHDNDEHTEEVHHGEEEHDHVGTDPHYWLTVPNAILIAQQVQKELSILYPEKSAVFERNYLAYKEQLELLDAEIRQELSSLPTKDIATFHNAWNYFSEEYGINVVATFEEFPGEEPTGQYLAEFQQKVKEGNVKAIFSEPQFSTKSLEPIARDLGVSISTLDPLGGVSSRDSFEELLRYNTNQIVNALK